MAMEIYDTIDCEQKNATDSLEKANTSVNEYNEKLQTTHDREKTSGVSKFVCLTVKQQKCLLLLCVMTGVFVSLASLCVTILEKVETVHGSWSGWAHWEACTTTCDLGMQRRQRNCSNPAPSGNGRQCLGIDNEHRLCFSGPCTKQTSTTMESTAPLPCCQDEYEYGYYGHDYTMFDILSRGDCRPCVNRIDTEDHYDDNESTAMEATSPLPCCQNEYVYEHQYYSYYEYYWYDDSIHNTPSRDDCRPCGNRIDTDDDYDVNGKMTNATTGVEGCYCWAIVLSILVLLNN